MKFRIALTRLRTAVHRLLIETGRWVKPKPIALENRKFITCNIIEDEFHLKLVCPMYSSFRHYIPKYYTNRPSMFKFIELLNNNNELIVRWLALYCFKALEKKEILFCTIKVSPECKCIIIVFYCIIICVWVFSIYCNNYFTFVNVQIMCSRASRPNAKKKDS